ncbi:MAG TPA: hypothetical protein VKY90_17810 [Candidatus Dormibacteraeota bacterium]|nr:hypothetical protein [Candidatus Dormibacteraeota bacterium]
MRIPNQLHDSIGPSCAVADVRDGRATAWSGSQGVYQLRGALVILLGPLGERPGHLRSGVRLLWAQRG